MDPEFLELARAAVAALQLQAEAANSTSWVEIAELVIYGIGLAAIYRHLWKMKKYGQRRDREIDAWAASLRETNRKLAESGQRLGRVLAETRQARAHPSS